MMPAYLLSMPMIAIYFIAAVFLFIASISDIKTREVPDWLNYGSVGAGIGINLIFSLIYSDYSFIINSLIGLAAFFILAYILFYTGQWGGGDSKALMGIGALLGLNYKTGSLPISIVFLISTLVIGAFYGMAWTMYLALRKKEEFMKELRHLLSQKNIRRAKIAMLIAAVLAFAANFLPINALYKMMIVGITLAFYLTFYVWLFTKAVEKACMQKYVNPGQLTEGDWIVDDVVVGGKRICGPKDLGIEKKQIALLVKYYKAGKIKKVLIKEGIPFVPSFLVGFLAALVFGNIVNYLI